ncbi:RNA polymerase sigma factor [Cognatiyoonia sp. IB215446]|uniref:RNA polymerase sigma factor n=1 Tax=Cognatiyoonia sp. IB215446 TaxID=3097355 RepID=UPI002A0C8EB6|nr:RNA polymerase sigma factor [Cognatiyoonia sp. IB215446]MDX8348503.1 RNA polymerase sigma factor [Cognatiyoonia sp. IB215446]
MALATVTGIQSATRYSAGRNQPIERRGKIADGGWNLTSTPALQLCDLMTPDQFKTEMIGLLPRLRRFAMSLTRSGPDADDLLQEACTTALQKWQQYDPSQPFDRWMFRVVRNLWISEVRKRKVRQGEGQVDAEEAHELQAAGSAEETLTAQQVRKKVADLDEDLAQPLMLVCAEGYSYKEVSELLNIPIGTVMSRIHRARKLLVSSLSVEESLQR